MKEIGYYLKNPWNIIRGALRNHWFDWLPDSLYLQLKFRAVMGKRLDLKNPQSYNEKLQWLKLYNRNPLYITLVDKANVKNYVENVIGKEYVIPTLKVWDDVEDIDFEELPKSFVLKCTHDSGGVIVCPNKCEIDFGVVKAKLKRDLSRSFYLEHREWPYKGVKPQIIAEPYLVDSKTGELRDYKFLVFNGKVKIVYIATDRQKESETTFDFFDADFNHLNIINGHPNAIICPEKPTKFEEMKRLAERLASDIPHVRVDFYEKDGQIFFGEMTFFHMSGMTPFEPDEWDYIIGEWLQLPPKYIA